MRNNLEYFKSGIIRGHTYLTYSKPLGDAPIAMSKMEEQDDNLVGLGTYYSINKLSSIVGDGFKPFEVINESFDCVHLSISPNGEEGLIKTYLSSMSVVNMRNPDGLLEFDMEVEDVDYVNLDPIKMYFMFCNEDEMFRRDNILQEPI